MRSYINYLGLVILLVLFTNALFSQNDTINCYSQPLQDVFLTELVYPQEKCEIQLSCFPQFRNGNEMNLINLPLSLEYGITNRWQMELSWNTFQKSFSGLTPAKNEIANLEVGTQYSFMNIGNTNFHAAFGFEIEVPLSGNEDGLGENQWEYAPYISGALDFPSLNNSQFFAQAGIDLAANRTSENEAEEQEINLSGGLFIPFNKTIFSSEISWWGSLDADENENQLYLTPGFIFNLPGTWETGIGMPIGLNKKSDSFMILAILTFEFSLTEEIEHPNSE